MGMDAMVRWLGKLKIYSTCGLIFFASRLIAMLPLAREPKD